MTETYNNFLQQYNSVGTQKADGYDLSHFEKMNINEKKNAFELLTNELNSPGVAKWLFYLNYDKALKTLLLFISNKKMGQAGLHRVYSELYFQTRDNTYLNMLIGNYDIYLDCEKDEAVWLIHKCKPEYSISSNFYKKIILSETNIEVISSASDFFLKINGYSTNTKKEFIEFFKIRKKLETGNLEMQLSVISSIEKNKQQKSGIASAPR
ncbi:hypothetical protein ACR30L_09755 [Psychromonas sp. PT13]|uniref:hypothetical protein n=1 Tax=Psychromonas sp. PT13 TaxID=3439547 RepID=UPI003EBF358A